MVSDTSSLTSDVRAIELEINELQEHKDPYVHIIIAQALSHRMTLVSSDKKFPFYRRQGLQLIANY